MAGEVTAAETTEELAAEAAIAVKPVRVIYDGPRPSLRCAGRVWKRGKSQDVDAECAAIALTHPAFRQLRVRAGR